MVINYIAYFTISPNYRKAPQFKYPRGVQDVVDCYLAVMGHVESNLPCLAPKRVVIAGESAGGNFAIVMCKVLAKLGIEVPRILFAYAPVDAGAWLAPCPGRGLIYLSRINALVDVVLPPCLFFEAQVAYSHDDQIDYTADRTPTYRRRNFLMPVMLKVKRQCEQDPFYRAALGDMSMFSDTSE